MTVETSVLLNTNINVANMVYDKWFMRFNRSSW